MAWFKSSHPSSLLGLSLEGRQIEGVVLQRSNGSVKADHVFRAALSLDPLTNDPELVGRELRNHLEEAGVRERRCAVCIPLQWALSLQVKVPEMTEADIPGFLRLEAERGFPYAPDDLSIAISRFRAPNGEQHALLVAVPKSHLVLLEKSLRAARLKPLSFSLGIAAVQEASDASAEGLLTLAIGEAGVDLQVSIKGGVAALRTLEGAFETEGSQRRVDAGLLARELRITLGQMPQELRESVHRIKVFGPADMVKPLVAEMTPMARGMGLLVEPGAAPRAEGYDPQTSNQGGAAAALALAIRLMAGPPAGFEFLPPKQHPLAQAMARFSSRRMLYAGASVGAVVVVVVMLFLWQQWRLSSLESKWRAIQPRVNDLEADQQQMRKFRPWFDESARTMRILRRVTEAFPEDGSVSAKTLEIKDLSEVACSGQARDNQALLKLMDQLRAATQITDLKVPQVRGKSPLQFNLNFRWMEGTSHD